MWIKYANVWLYKRKIPPYLHSTLNNVEMHFISGSFCYFFISFIIHMCLRQLLNGTFILEIKISVRQGKIKMWEIIHPLNFMRLPYLSCCQLIISQRIHTEAGTFHSDAGFNLHRSRPLEFYLMSFPVSTSFHISLTSSPSSRHYRPDGVSDRMCEIRSQKLDGFLCLWV